MATEKIETKNRTKNDRIYIRLNAQVKRDFEIVAEYKGLSTSALMHSLIVQTIHKTKEDKPELFYNLPELPDVSDEKTKKKGLSLSEKLIKKKSKKNSPKTFTTGDGITIPLVEEGLDEDDK